MKIQSFPDLIQFVLTHYDKARDWDAKVLFEWLWFHQSEAHILIVEDNLHNAVGLAIIHPVMDAPQGENGFDQEGPCLYVDMAIALGKGVLAALGFAALKRFGMRQTVAWMRESGIIYEFPATTVRRNLFRKKRGMMLHLAMKG